MHRLVLSCYYFGMSKYIKFTDAQRRANDKYLQKLDSFSLRTPKETGAAIREAAARAGQSTNAYILQAVLARMENEKQDI